MQGKKNSFWQQLKAKYHVAVVNETTLAERWHVRLSLLNLILAFVGTTLVTLVLFSLFIWLTPLKNYLPGYNEDLREELIADNMRVDSLLTLLSAQQEYLNTMHRVVAGEIETDSVKPLDSVYVAKKEELLVTSSEVVDSFMANYETAARDNLTLFDQALQNESMQVLFKPVGGVVTESFSHSHPGVRILAASHAPVASVLAGTVVAVSFNVQERWTVVVQHDANYLSIYSNLGEALCAVGQTVKAGEALALSSAQVPVGLQIWQRGVALDPESLIAF